MKRGHAPSRWHWSWGGPLLVLLLLPLSAGGCHLIFPFTFRASSDSDSGPAEGGVDLQGGDGDGPPTDTRPFVDPNAPFETPVPLTVNTPGMHEEEPSLTADMLEIYFTKEDPQVQQSQDLYYARRKEVDAVWEGPTRIDTVSTTTVDEFHPWISDDGLALHFSREDPADVWTYYLFRSTRPNREGPWSAVALVKMPTDPERVIPGRLTGNGKTMVFMLNVKPELWWDLALATGPSVDGLSWSAYVELAEVSVDGYTDNHPWINDDLTVIYFDSDRAGGAGLRDIYVATRASTQESFGPPHLLAGKDLNSAFNEEDVWLSPDLKTIYFVSDRAGTKDIYVATRAP